MTTMPVPTDITAGTLTITNGSTAVTGVGTAWLASDLRQGDIILWIEGGDGFQTPILADVPASNTAITLVEPWEGPTLTGARYRIRYQWDSSRVSAQSRQLIELLDNGNVLALTGLTGPGVPVFDGPHSMVVKPESDFVNGVAYDVQVDLLADRDAYNGQTAGFAVLVSNVGDGRSAIYSKASNTSGDWTDPAYVTGPQGAASTVPGVVWRGSYSGATLYAINDGVTFNGSSFRKLTTAAAGNAPSGATPPVNNANWEVLAAKGLNGTGTGDVVGPASAIADRIAAFDGTTGKLIKDSGVNLQDLKWLSKAIGEFYAVDTSIAGVDLPPVGSSLYRYILLTAGETDPGEYNSGVLISESVTGTAPLVQATAVVSLSGSPLDGRTIRLINTERRVLRAGSAGTVESDALQGFKTRFAAGGTADGSPFSSGGTTYRVPWSASGGSPVTSDIVSDGTNGTPRTANETRPKSIGVTYYMRVK